MSLALRRPIEPGPDWDAVAAAVVAQRPIAVLLDFRGAGGVCGALTGAVPSAAAGRVGGELVEQRLAETPEAVVVVDAPTPAAVCAVLAPWQ